MKKSKMLVVLFLLAMMSVFSTTLYAQSEEEGYNVVALKYKQADGKMTTGLASEDDGYVRITQPTKISTTTFESKINLMGETEQGTEITIEIYNKKDSTKTDKSAYKDEATVTYELKTVGLTGTFSQLLELLEGDNKIVLSYSNAKDKKDDEMVFYITRESEQNKELIKNYIVFSGVKISE